MERRKDNGRKRKETRINIGRRRYGSEGWRRRKDNGRKRKEMRRV
jgi:hypothetical protein